MYFVSFLYLFITPREHSPFDCITASQSDCIPRTPVSTFVMPLVLIRLFVMFFLPVSNMGIPLIVTAQTDKFCEYALVAVDMFHPLLSLFFF